VTDAALTQCIKDIRRQLGDDAGAPRFVRTVSGHGYCFIAEVGEERPDSDRIVVPSAPAAAQAPADVSAGTAAAEAGPSLPRWLTDSAAATAGGALAGLLGGLLYGSALAYAPQSQGLGSLSVLFVLLALSMLVGMAGALGVGLGIAGGRLLGSGAAWTLAGGAFGGCVVGGLARLIGSDTFALLVGQAPVGITGGLEGAAIGFSVAAGLLLGGGLEANDWRRPAGFAAISTGLAGTLIPLAGGSLMASSLAQVATAFEGSRLDMAPLSQLFGQPQFGLLSGTALGALEGAVFGACVVAALLLARREGVR
jgi:hypothetical protein